jgi:uncharacterized membrane protein
MDKNRLLAFSDGVIAIIITIMVLEMKVPTQSGHLSDLFPLLPVFLSYALSYLYIAIYWNNHHHLFQASDKVNGKVLWANQHLLFWLSLTPFVTRWVGVNNFDSFSMACYGIVFLMAAIAYYMLQQILVRTHGVESTLSKAVGVDFKGPASLGLYVLGIAVAFWNNILAAAIYALVAFIWLVPDRRIERVMEGQ